MPAEQNNPHSLELAQLDRHADTRAGALAFIQAAESLFKDPGSGLHHNLDAIREAAKQRDPQELFRRCLKLENDVGRHVQELEKLARKLSGLEAKTWIELEPPQWLEE